MMHSLGSAMYRKLRLNAEGAGPLPDRQTDRRTLTYVSGSLSLLLNYSQRNALTVYTQATRLFMMGRDVTSVPQGLMVGVIPS